MNGAPRSRRQIAALVAALALVGCALLGMAQPRQALLAYLAAYAFFLAPALGSITMLQVHALTGGRWGLDLRPVMLAATRVLPLLAALLLPILLGAAWLYPWADPQNASDPQLGQQRWYLNLPFFWLRAIVCMAAWLWLAYGTRRRIVDARPGASWAGFASAGLIVQALTVTVAAFDWIMSLVPQWHSSVFGWTVATGQMLTATALAVMFVACAGVALPARRLRDLGSVLTVLVLAWGYLALMDFLTAWIADLPSETAWYLPRLDTGWRWLGAALVLLHAIAFAALLSRRAKELRRWLQGIAFVLWIAQAAFVLWLVLPGQWVPSAPAFWTAPLAGLGIGAACWAMLDLRLAQSARSDGQGELAPGEAEVTA